MVTGQIIGDSCSAVQRKASGETRSHPDKERPAERAGGPWVYEKENRGPKKAGGGAAQRRILFISLRRSCCFFLIFSLISSAGLPSCSVLTRGSTNSMYAMSA